MAPINTAQKSNDIIHTISTSSNYICYFSFTTKKVIRYDSRLCTFICGYIQVHGDLAGNTVAATWAAMVWGS